MVVVEVYRGHKIEKDWTERGSMPCFSRIPYSTHLPPATGRPIWRTGCFANVEGARAEIDNYVDKKGVWAVTFIYDPVVPTEEEIEQIILPVEEWVEVGDVMKYVTEEGEVLRRPIEDEIIPAGNGVSLRDKIPIAFMLPIIVISGVIMLLVLLFTWRKK